MKVRVLEEHGASSALLGLSLSYGSPIEKMDTVAERLRFLGNGHNKFLESIVMWLDVTAARYFWQQFDTYRVGITKQSESTMHTMTKRPLQQSDFAHPIPEDLLSHLNRLIHEKAWEKVKWCLPESFLQRRIVCANYMTLQRIIRQRRTHRLHEWEEFTRQLLDQVEYPEYLDQEGDVE